MVTSKKACQMLGVHANTLRKWADNGKIKAIRTPAGQRLYDIQAFLLESKPKRKFIYCRVSSQNQKTELEAQIKYLRDRYPAHELIEDIGSGLNFKRKGFNALLELILSGDVEEIIVAHKDRLCRFGFEMLQSIASKNNCKLLVINDVDMSSEAELVSDLLSIVHVFSCRIDGLKKYSDKIKKDKDLSKEYFAG